jgi:antirestriction protein ArdC
MVIYFNVYYKDANDQNLSKFEARARADRGEEIQVLKFIKYYNVFNIADIEGIEFEIPEIELKPNEKIERCENIIENMPNRPELKSIDGNRAFYSPTHDFVNMPAIEQFETAEDYYATYFHELTHATGHASRLKRDEILNPHQFGSKPYSREELVAEMGASFLCSNCQIDYDSITENSAAYLAGWLNILRADSKFIFKAAAEAQKAADYILNRKPSDGEKE